MQLKKNITLMMTFLVLISCNSKTNNKSQNDIHTSSYSETNSSNGYPKSETKDEGSTVTIADEPIKKDCSETHSSADDAYTYCRRAYNSDDFGEIKSYLKKAMSSFEEAMSNAEDCKRDEAHSSAEEGYDYAKKGFRTDDFGEMKNYARKAKNSADDTMSKADDCTD